MEQHGGAAQARSRLQQSQRELAQLQPHSFEACVDTARKGLEDAGRRISNTERWQIVRFREPRCSDEP